MTGRTGMRSERGRWVLAGGYVACWVVGLLTGGPDLSPDADADAIAAEISGSVPILLFAVLVHGFAAATLIAWGRSLAEERPRTVLVLAAIAGVLSLVQLAGEIVLVTPPSASSDVAVWQSITRADGAKMLVLAGVVAVVHGRRRHGRIAFTIFSGITVLALLMSGVSYVALAPGLMATTALSLPLLLIWVLVATRVRTAGLRDVNAISRLTADR